MKRPKGHVVVGADARQVHGDRAAAFAARSGSTVFFSMNASPALAKKWLAASQPKDLVEAPWVSHPSIPASARHQFRNQRGTLQRVLPKSARILANTGDAIRSLVVGGAGFAVVPTQMVAEDLRVGRMMRVLPDWRCRKVIVHVCLPSRSHPPLAFASSWKSCALFRITGFEAVARERCASPEVAGCRGKRPRATCRP
jgi:DNA-binding transcriptional LysR family regulator